LRFAFHSFFFFN